MREFGVRFAARARYIVLERLRPRHVWHRGFMTQPGLVDLERRVHAEDCLAVLHRNDAPGGEARAVADTLDLVQHGPSLFASAHEIAVQRMRQARIDGIRRRAQRLRQHLAAEQTSLASLVGTAKHVQLDRLEFQ